MKNMLRHIKSFFVFVPVQIATAERSNDVHDYRMNHLLFFDKLSNFSISTCIKISFNYNYPELPFFLSTFPLFFLRRSFLAFFASLSRTCFHSNIQFFNFFRAEALPRTSTLLAGQYFSVHSRLQATTTQDKA